MVEKGDQFTNAMKEYHKAMTLSSYGEAALDLLKQHFFKGLVAGAGLAGGGYALSRYFKSEP